MIGVEVVPGRRGLGDDEGELAVGLAEEAGRHSQGDDEDVRLGDPAAHAFAHQGAVGLLDRRRRRPGDPIFDPVQQIAVGVGRVDVLADLLGEHAAAILAQPLGQILGEARAEGHEHAVGLDDRRALGMAQDVALDKASRVLEGRGPRRPRRHFGARRPTGLGPGQLEQQGGFLVHRTVLDGLQQSGLRLLVTMPAHHGLAEPAVGIAMLGEVLDGLAGKRVGLVPILELRRAGQRMRVAVPPLLVGKERVGIRQQLKEQLQRLGILLLLTKFVGLAKDRRVRGADIVRHKVSSGADIAPNPLLSSQQFHPASSHIAASAARRALAHST